MNKRLKQGVDAEIVSRNSKGRFEKGVSGNPRGRPSNSEAIRKLLDPRKDELVSKAIELALAGDTTALKICLDRLAPLLKSEGTLVIIKGMDHAETLLEKADLVVESVSNGHLTLEDAEKFLRVLASHAKVIEVQDLESRIEFLENKSSEEVK